ncbi:hypothetical protein ABPG75_001704 [Micractinium tetrahymenae]
MRPFSSAACGAQRKQQEVAAKLQELGEEALEERLRSATSTPARLSHRLTELIATIVPQGRPVLVLELARGPEAPSSESLGQLAAALVAAGADALAVKTDGADTPEPLKDLLAVSQAANEAAKRRQPHGGVMAAAAAAGGLGGGPTAAELGVPVLQRDWYLHPIQIVEAKEAGAAGAIGTIASVTSRGTPLMSSFASAVGLDCPVEIVNMQELQAMERFQVPFFGMNLSVGLSVSLQGFGLQVAKGEHERPCCGAGAHCGCCVGRATGRSQNLHAGVAAHRTVGPPPALQACWGSCRLEPSAWWEQRAWRRRDKHGWRVQTACW